MIKSIYRYQNYIKIFNHDEDPRVNLFLDALYDISIENMKANGRTKLEYSDVYFKKPIKDSHFHSYNNLEMFDKENEYEQLLIKSDPFTQENFEEVDNTSLSLDLNSYVESAKTNIHSEWVTFFGNLIIRCHNRGTSEIFPSIFTNYENIEDYLYSDNESNLFNEYIIPHKFISDVIKIIKMIDPLSPDYDGDSGICRFMQLLLIKIMKLGSDDKYNISNLNNYDFKSHDETPIRHAKYTPKALEQFKDVNYFCFYDMYTIYSRLGLGNFYSNYYSQSYGKSKNSKLKYYDCVNAGFGIIVYGNPSLISTYNIQSENQFVPIFSTIGIRLKQGMNSMEGDPTQDEAKIQNALVLNKTNKSDFKSVMYHYDNHKVELDDEERTMGLKAYDLTKLELVPKKEEVLFKYLDNFDLLHVTRESSEKELHKTKFNLVSNFKDFDILDTHPLCSSIFGKIDDLKLNPSDIPEYHISSSYIHKNIFIHTFLDYLMVTYILLKNSNTTKVNNIYTKNAEKYLDYVKKLIEGLTNNTFKTGLPFVISSINSLATSNKLKLGLAKKQNLGHKLEIGKKIVKENTIDTLYDYGDSKNIIHLVQAASLLSSNSNFKTHSTLEYKKLKHEINYQISLADHFNDLFKLHSSVYNSLNIAQNIYKSSPIENYHYLEDNLKIKNNKSWGNYTYYQKKTKLNNSDNYVNSSVNPKDAPWCDKYDPVNAEDLFHDDNNILLFNLIESDGTFVRNEMFSVDNNLFSLLVDNKGNILNSNVNKLNLKTYSSGQHGLRSNKITSTDNYFGLNNEFFIGGGKSDVIDYMDIREIIQNLYSKLNNPSFNLGIDEDQLKEILKSDNSDNLNLINYKKSFDDYTSKHTTYVSGLKKFTQLTSSMGIELGTDNFNDIYKKVTSNKPEFDFNKLTSDDKLTLENIINNRVKIYTLSHYNPKDNFKFSNKDDVKLFNYDNKIVLVVYFAFKLIQLLNLGYLSTKQTSKSSGKISLAWNKITLNDIKSEKLNLSEGIDNDTNCRDVFNNSYGSLTSILSNIKISRPSLTSFESVKQCHDITQNNVPLITTGAIPGGYNTRYNMTNIENHINAGAGGLNVLGVHKSHFLSWIYQTAISRKLLQKVVTLPINNKLRIREAAEKNSSDIMDHTLEKLIINGANEEATSYEVMLGLHALLYFIYGRVYEIHNLQKYNNYLLTQNSNHINYIEHNQAIRMIFSLEGLYNIKIPDFSENDGYIIEIINAMYDSEYIPIHSEYYIDIDILIQIFIDTEENNYSQLVNITNNFTPQEEQAFNYALGIMGIAPVASGAIVNNVQLSYLIWRIYHSLTISINEKNNLCYKIMENFRGKPNKTHFISENFDIDYMIYYSQLELDRKITNILQRPDTKYINNDVFVTPNMRKLVQKEFDKLNIKNVNLDNIYLCKNHKVLGSNFVFNFAYVFNNNNNNNNKSIYEINTNSASKINILYNYSNMQSDNNIYNNTFKDHRYSDNCVLYDNSIFLNGILMDYSNEMKITHNFKSESSIPNLQDNEKRDFYNLFQNSDDSKIGSLFTTTQKKQDIIKNLIIERYNETTDIENCKIILLFGILLCNNKKFDINKIMDIVNNLYKKITSTTRDEQDLKKNYIYTYGAYYSINLILLDYLFLLDLNTGIFERQMFLYQDCVIPFMSSILQSQMPNHIEILNKYLGLFQYDVLDEIDNIYNMRGLFNNSFRPLLLRELNDSRQLKEFGELCIKKLNISNPFDLESFSYNNFMKNHEFESNILEYNKFMNLFKKNTNILEQNILNNINTINTITTTDNNLMDSEYKKYIILNILKSFNITDGEKDISDLIDEISNMISIDDTKELDDNIFDYINRNTAILPGEYADKCNESGNVAQIMNYIKGLPNTNTSNNNTINGYLQNHKDYINTKLNPDNISPFVGSSILSDLNSKNEIFNIINKMQLPFISGQIMFTIIFVYSIYKILGGDYQTFSNVDFSPCFYNYGKLDNIDPNKDNYVPKNGKKSSGSFKLPPISANTNKNIFKLSQLSIDYVLAMMEEICKNTNWIFSEKQSRENTVEFINFLHKETVEVEYDLSNSYVKKCVDNNIHIIENTNYKHTDNKKAKIPVLFKILNNSLSSNELYKLSTKLVTQFAFNPYVRNVLEYKIPPSKYSFSKFEESLIVLNNNEKPYFIFNKNEIRMDRFNRSNLGWATLNEIPITEVFHNRRTGLSKNSDIGYFFPLTQDSKVLGNVYKFPQLQITLENQQLLKEEKNKNMHIRYLTEIDKILQKESLNILKDKYKTVYVDNKFENIDTPKSLIKILNIKDDVDENNVIQLLSNNNYINIEKNKILPNITDLNIDKNIFTVNMNEIQNINKNTLTSYLYQSNEEDLNESEETKEIIEVMNSNGEILKINVHNSRILKAFNNSQRSEYEVLSRSNLYEQNISNVKYYNVPGNININEIKVKELYHINRKASNLLKEILFYDFMHHLDNITPTTYEIFNYNIAKYTSKKLVEMEQDVKKTPIPEPLTDAFLESLGYKLDSVGLEYEDFYIRAEEKIHAQPDGTLGYMDNGKFISVLSDEHIKKTDWHNQSCKLTHIVRDGDKITCSAFLQKCLQNEEKNLKGCKEFMQSSKFWSSVKKDFKETNPKTLILILKAFGFLKYEDETTKLSMYENYNSWISRLSTQIQQKDFDLTEEEFKKIKQNDNLRVYLSGIIDKINKNPAILNVNYKGKKKLHDTIDPKYKLPYYTSTSNKDKRSLNVVIRSAYGRNMNNATKMEAYIQSIIGNKGLSRTQFGGAPESVILIGPVFESIFNKTLIELNKLNKDIDQNEKAQILKMIENIKKTEVNLRSILKYMTRYIQLYNSIPQDGEKHLNFSVIRDLVEKYKNKATKLYPKQLNLNTVLNEIIEIINKQSNNKTIVTGPNNLTDVNIKDLKL